MNRGEQRQDQEARGWLLAIMESSDDAIIGTTLDGIITSWNSGAEKLYSYSSQDVIGHSISILIPPNRSEEILRILERIRRGERLDRYETVHLCKNGGRIEVSVTASPVRNSEGSVLGVCAIAHDITERERAEERQRLLAEASQVFSGLVTDYEALLQRIAEQVVEATGDACTVRLLSEDGRWLRPVAGHHPDPELTSAIWAVMQDTVERSDIGVWQPVIQEQRTIRIAVPPQKIPLGASQEQAEFMRRYPMSAIMGAPLVARGRILGGVSLVRYGRQSPYTEEEEEFLRDLSDRAALAIDNALLVTERRRNEEELRASQKDLEYLRYAIDESTIVAFTDRTGKITYVNEKFLEISKYSREELLGQDHRIINSGYHPKEYIRNLWRTIARGHVWRGELRNRAKDGSIYWVDTTIVPFLNDQGKPHRYVAIRHDVTARKLAEERLQDTLERLLAFYEGGQVLGSILKREEICSKLLETMQRASGLSVAAVELVDERGSLRTLCTTGEEDFLHRVRSAQEEARGARREALESGERRWLGLRSSSGAAQEVSLSAGLCLPLRVRERLVGIVEAYGDEDLLEPETAETLSGLANQAASALENARLYEELAERERRLRELVGQILKAQEEERRRVAYEIHDGLAQVAAAAHQYLQGFAKRYSPESASGKEELKEALDLIQQAVREARQVIANLRPTALDDFGLARALRMHAEELSVAEDLQITYEESLGNVRLPQETETTLFRIAQEALRNARKHARSPHTRVKLERLKRSVRLEVRDWGRGFDVDEVTNGGGGPGERVGIVGMHERVALLGGELKIESQPEVGTTVVAEVPLDEREEERYER